MWSTTELSLVGFLTIIVVYYAYWIHKWRNPKHNGILPPGSMGLPLIGETLELLIPSNSLDLHPFLKKRIRRYGSIFTSNIAGRPIVISADQEFNNWIIKQEGTLVELWYMDSFSKLFPLHQDKTSGIIHKYWRGLLLNHIGADRLKANLLPEMEDAVNRTLRAWSCQESIEVKHASATMVFNFTTKLLTGYDDEQSSEKISDKFTGLLQGLMSFPLNIPGTAYHRCLQNRQKVLDVLRRIIREKRSSDVKEGDEEDFLDKAIEDIDNKEEFLTDDFIVYLLSGILFASFETIAFALTLALKFLAENSSALAELTAEHDKIRRNRKESSANSSLTWDEYKSMTFTLQVINETLRLGTVAPGLLRRAKQEIRMKGYTIPAGWTIMLVNFASQLNPDIYKDPLTFNPWRWKELDSYTISKNFSPFGGGIRQCAGADFSKAFLATFLHVLVTNYRWTKIKGGQVRRNPFLGFGDGVHLKFFMKNGE